MQLGRALPCILCHIANADPRLGPVYMAKTDLSDAYMRVWIKLKDVPKLAFAIPPIPTNPEPLIGFHLSLPMGYIESAPYFCAASKTVADLPNHREDRDAPHRLETLANTKPPADDPSDGGVPTDKEERAIAQFFATLPPEEQQRCVDYVDVYVDDYICLRQGSQNMRRRTTRRLFHNIDHVFRPNNANDTNGRREPNSKKNSKKWTLASQPSRKSSFGS